MYENPTDTAALPTDVWITRLERFASQVSCKQTSNAGILWFMLSVVQVGKSQSAEQVGRDEPGDPTKRLHTRVCADLDSVTFSIQCGGNGAKI